MNRSPDWSLWRSFGAVVEAGSLSAAARKLALSQPTLGRHIESLEQALGIALFERTLSGLKPTETALRLYEPVAGAARALSETGADLIIAWQIAPSWRISSCSASASGFVAPPIRAW